MLSAAWKTEAGRLHIPSLGYRVQDPVVKAKDWRTLFGGRAFTKSGLVFFLAVK